MYVADCLIVQGLLDNLLLILLLWTKANKFCCFRPN